MSGRRKPKQLENAATASAQRIEVFERDSHQCAFEVRIEALPGETHWQGHRLIRERERTWVRCGRAAQQMAHIFRRWRCGTAKFDPAVCIAACQEHHQKFDNRQHHDLVRPPAEAVERTDAGLSCFSGVLVAAVEEVSQGH
jgi:hypothetical protein